MYVFPVLDAVHKCTLTSFRWLLLKLTAAADTRAWLPVEETGGYREIIGYVASLM